MVGENSVYSELLDPISVKITGTVKALDTSEAITGVEVRIIKYNPTTDESTYLEVDSSTLTATTSTDGTFDFGNAIELDVDSYQHYLELTDPNGAYYTNDSTLIYAVRDSTLTFDDLQLAALSPQYFTVVSGTIKDLVTGSNVEGLSVSVTNINDSSEIYEAESDVDGEFSITNVPINFYTLTLDGSDLGTAYIVEDSELVLENSLSNNLGDLLVAPATNDDDLRIVLNWTNSALNLDTQFSMPKATFIFNHLGTRQVDMRSSLFSINPAFGFAERTAYWPESMGGEESFLGNRVRLYPSADETADENFDAMNHIVGDNRTIAQIDTESIDGSVPEVLTLFKDNPLNSYPGSPLAYYYDFTKEGVNYTYYPFGMAIYQVHCANEGGSIYDSGAEVKVYQGSTYLGKFNVADLDIDSGESNRRFWPVLQIEIGFTTSTPSSADDIYFRVVPYGSGASIPSNRFPGFFYQETELPGNANFTYLLDKEEYINFYNLNNNISLQKILLSDDGRVFSYSDQCMSQDLGWYNHIAKTETINEIDYTHDGITLDASTPYTSAFYWSSFPGDSDWLESVEPGASKLFLAHEESTASLPVLDRGQAGYDPGTSEGDSQHPSLLKESTDLIEYAETGVGRINDYTIVNMSDDKYSYLLLATDKGPRGATSVYDDVLSYNDLSPVLSSFPTDFWVDDTTGDVLSADINMDIAVTATNRDGGVGSFALIGGTGLFQLNTENITAQPEPYANYNAGWSTKAVFNDVNFDGTDPVNLSSPSFIITAIEEQPSNNSNHVFSVAVQKGTTKIPELYTVVFKAEGELEHINQRPNQGLIINDMMYLDIGQDLYLIMATDQGLFFCAEWNKTDIRAYLPNILGGMNITRMFNYNGYLGLLIEDGGMIYGPLPDSYSDLESL